MENRINIATLLKHCPTGMELDCLMYDNVYFKCIREHAVYPIVCYTINSKGETEEITFNWYGKYALLDTAKYVIFPKGKTTWEGFHRPFKDGDIVTTNNGAWIGITTGGAMGELMPTYCVITRNGTFEAYLDTKKSWYFSRFATKEERQKLFDEIKAHGYTWNSETKTLEKLIQPQFKVGNVIQDKDGYKVRVTEVNIEDECYGYESMIAKGIGGIAFREQDNWELVPNKFDITTLKPFDKVLVRDGDNETWVNAFFGFRDTVTYKVCTFVTGNENWHQCIPYKGNEHLLGTNNDCDEFYKTWE